ncbi:MAG: STAS domain-containing protein [Planctomycetota bacterium]|nr:STAS domain-containing protein [Planctomycetota bacterium]
MNVRFDEHGTLCVVTLEGEMVGESVESVRRACLERIQAGVRDLILDLSSIAMVDSSGLEAMLDLADLTTERQGRCMLAAPDEGLRSILEITRRHERLEIHAAVDAAARTLR